MSKTKKDLIIIGAGLSGLYLATLLREEFNVTILEARERLGGRILTQDGHDLGPSWIWSHQKKILALTQELNLELFSQYTIGEALYDSPSGVHRFNAPPSAPCARMVGGLDMLVQALFSKLDAQKIYKNEQVEKVSYENYTIKVKTSTQEYRADYVLSTLAPRLAYESIEYEPALDSKIEKKLLDTPTWMGNISKCVIEFEEAFWKYEGLSGFIYSPLGPLGEIHDASTADKAALFGFVYSKSSTADIIEDVKAQMLRLFGHKAKSITNIYFTNWKNERFSSSTYDSKALSSHPDYGLTLSSFNDKLIFMGTETSFDNGGYLEGAIASALEVSKKLKLVSY